MKFGLLLFAALCVSASADNWRQVNGVKVNLTPLDDWIAKPDGERPLKHWKQVEILELKEVMGSWQKCAVKIEAEGAKEILIVGLPYQTTEFLKKQKQKADAIASLKAQIQSDESAAKKIKTATRRGMRTGWAASHSYDKEMAVEEIQRKKASLAELQSEPKSAQKQAKAPNTVLAMFSGKTYSGLSIWDCGVPVGTK